MKTEYQYIRFDEEPTPNKTRWFVIKNIKSDAILGEVKWFGAFRSYCLHTHPNAVFNSSCLTDIQDFIKQLMADWKKNKNKIEVDLE